MTSDRFQGRRVVLTGVGSGIGREVARLLVAEGATVFGMDVNQAGMTETAKLVDGPGSLHTHEIDLSDEAQLSEAADRGLEVLGGVDALINVAGMLRPCPLEQTTLADYRRLLEVNFLAPVNLCRLLVPYLPDGSGVVVNTCSTSATKAHPQMTGYAASKGALLSFSFSLAAELAPRRIRVVAVSPGGTQTPMTGDQSRFEHVNTAWYARTYPLWGQPAQPREIAEGIVFAASPQASYLNGVEMRLDGGSHV